MPDRHSCTAYDECRDGSKNPLWSCIHGAYHSSGIPQYPSRHNCDLYMETLLLISIATNLLILILLFYETFRCILNMSNSNSSTSWWEWLFGPSEPTDSTQVDPDNLMGIRDDVLAYQLQQAFADNEHRERRVAQSPAATPPPPPPYTHRSGHGNFISRAEYEASVESLRPLMELMQRRIMALEAFVGMPAPGTVAGSTDEPENETQDEPQSTASNSSEITTPSTEHSPLASRDQGSSKLSDDWEIIEHECLK